MAKKRSKPRTRFEAQSVPGKVVVLRDTGEQEGCGWLFPESDLCAGTRSANLFTGDYSLEGYYDSKLFVIERKGSVGEFVANMTQKEKWEDFEDELGRLEEFAHPFVVCEFPFYLLKTYPEGSDVPKKVWPHIRVTPQFILKRFEEICIRFKTKFIFADAPLLAREVAGGLFKRVLENVPPQNQA